MLVLYHSLCFKSAFISSQNVFSVTHMRLLTSQIHLLTAQNISSASVSCLGDNQQDSAPLTTSEPAAASIITHPPGNAIRRAAGLKAACK